MTQYLLALRTGLIVWVTLTLMPLESVFDAIEAELGRGELNHDAD